MVFSARPATVLCLGLVLAAPIARAQTVPPSSGTPQPATLLPSAFGRFNATAPPQTGADPTAADSSNASILKEYGLKDFAVGDYTHGASKLAVRAMHFVDATGAYGAFTFYRKPGMHPADIGKQAAADTGEVVFWSGTTFVDATANHIGPDERTALKALASALPQNTGPEGVAPSLPRYLPPESLDKSTVRYTIGPDAYLKTGGVLPLAIIDFSRDAEAVTAQYPLPSGVGTLTILEYPTPQMASERAKAIEAMLKSAALPAALQGGDPAVLGVNWSGPLVAVTSGKISVDDARTLRDHVKYEAAVTWDHTEAYVGEVRKTARLLLGILYLTGILGGGAILLGLFLGGGRAAVRVMRGKPVSTLNDDDFISLKLGG